MDIDPAVRATAELAATRFRRWRDAAMFSGGAAEFHAPQSSAVHAWAGLMGLIAFFAEACARRKEETANDPPAPDFDSATRLGFRHLDPDELAQDKDLQPGLDALGSRAEAALSLARLMRREDATAGATLRAFERSTGSRLFGGEDFTSERLSETRRYSIVNADVLDDLAQAALEYAPVLSLEPGAIGPAQRGSDDRSSEVRRLLKRHRAADPELDAVFESRPDSADHLGTALLSTTELREVAISLRVWIPEQDVSRLRSG